jgi:hypothetical protein
MSHSRGKRFCLKELRNILPKEILPLNEKFNEKIFNVRNHVLARLAAVIPATWQVEMSRSWLKVSLGKSTRSYLKIKLKTNQTTSNKTKQNRKIGA